MNVVQFYDDRNNFFKVRYENDLGTGAFKRIIWVWKDKSWDGVLASPFLNLLEGNEDLANINEFSVYHLNDVIVSPFWTIATDLADGQF